MKLHHYSYRLIITVVSLFFLNGFQTGPQKVLVQDNPVLAPNVATLPVIDGTGDDPCWQNVPWQSIDQVWIPYGANVASNDYSGRYKVVWSSTTNLLYFLVEVTDDVFVDGYVPNTAGGAIYDFDMTEVFIDEDTSGGEHRYDGSGTNAENAFAYHLYAAFPAEGEVTTNLLVEDMAGTQSNPRRPDYAPHFPEFAMRLSGHTVLREFSLIVYNDTYDENNKDAARVQLHLDKVIGLSVACNDNDNPAEYPKRRDNMFGSVWEPRPGNLHWMNADYFGRIKLVSSIPSSVAGERIAPANTIKLSPNPASEYSQLQMDNSYRGEISIRLFNLLGQEVFRTPASKTEQLFTQTLVLDHLPSGIYFLRTQMGQSIFTQKLIVANK
ncbi:MAG: T9SS type A sorting domain-containing protein [candidate division KSB1 bacterium]|nr:T9SS type A sorting domain-containing protein [candidate division KSB1 bacterium]MDZ7304203.1 T9SS type A sorting domain-containing protein [candidate division KSB1 bacterium]MDZ7313427.1 T9SS type A sorting domain-containing protein [candidate division KSB1 bacterium]